MFKRLQLQLPASPSIPTATPSIAELTAERGGGNHSTSLAPRHCSYFLPQHYEPNYSYPLLVWLHASQGNEKQVHRVLPLVSMRNYAAVSMRGNVRSGNGWDWQVESTSAYHDVEQRILDVVDSARDRMNIHSQRIFVAGYQSGGALAVKLALRRPTEFAGAISLGGSLPTGSHLFGNLQHSRKFPLLISKGQEGCPVAMDDLCDRLKLFHSANLQVMLRLYPGADELTTSMLSDMNEWIMQRVTGIPTLEVEEESSATDPRNEIWN